MKKLLAGLLIGALGVASASASSFVVTGKLKGAGRGYIGCLEGRYESFHSCLVVLDDGTDVRAVIQVLTSTYSVASTGLYNLMYVEDIHIPASSISVVDKGPNDVKWLELDINFPRTGHLTLTVFSPTDDFGPGHGQALCDETSYVMSSSEVGTYTFDDGYVNGMEVMTYGRNCNAYWTAPASGHWAMNTATREGNLPQ